MNQKMRVNTTTQPPTVDLKPALPPDIPDRSVNIRDFGALGNGLHDNTNAINEAIRHVAELGGGKVVIPEGVWLTGPIVLHNRIELHAEAGSLVLFSRNFADYPLIMSHFEGRKTVRCRSPLDAEGVEHIAITGSGIFDGGGDAWRPVKQSKMADNQWRKLIESGGVVSESGTHWYPSEAARNGREIVEQLIAEGNHDVEAYEPVRDYLRPNMLSFRYCKYIMLDGPTFQNSPAWCLHPWASEHVTVRHVTVRNPWYAQNGDGLDIDSCKYVIVENSTFDVGDDAICLKSGKNKDGRDLGLPSEHIQVRNCVVYHGHGGIVVGSEMSGGVRNVSVSDCTFIGTDIGIRFKSCRGRGGIVENIDISRIRMKDIDGDAISFNLYYEGHSGSGQYGGDAAQPVSEETPLFRNIHIQDIVCSGARKALLINGLPEMPIDNLALVNAFVISDEGIVCRHAKDIYLRDVHVVFDEGEAALFHQCSNVDINGVELRTERKENRVIRVTGERTGQFSVAGLPADTALELSPEVNKQEVIED